MPDLRRPSNTESPDDTDRGPPRRPRGDVRAQIVKAATRLLAAHGFDGMTLQAVADEVGIRKPSVLHHFPSKEALRDAVLGDILEHWGRLVPQIMLNAGQRNQRFENLTRELIGFFSADPDRAHLVVREILDRPVEFRELFSAHIQPWLTMIGHGVREGQQLGMYRVDVDPEEYLLHMLELIIVSIATRDILAPPSPKDEGERAERHYRELLRIARTSLFTSDKEPAAPQKRKGRG